MLLLVVLSSSVTTSAGLKLTQAPAHGRTASVVMRGTRPKKAPAAKKAKVSRTKAQSKVARPHVAAPAPTEEEVRERHMQTICAVATEHANALADGLERHGLLMELMARSLEQLLRDPHESLCWVSPLLRIALQVAQAMSYLHGCNVVHGDLKPANVMLGPEPLLHVKLVDFGESRRIQQSPGGMGQGRSLSERADVWAFGGLLVHMERRIPPFNPAPPMPWLLGVERGDIIPEWPAALATLAFQCSMIGMGAVDANAAAKDAAASIRFTNCVAALRAIASTLGVASPLIGGSGGGSSSSSGIRHGDLRLVTASASPPDASLSDRSGSCSSCASAASTVLDLISETDGSRSAGLSVSQRILPPRPLPEWCSGRTVGSASSRCDRSIAGANEAAGGRDEWRAMETTNEPRPTAQLPRQGSAEFRRRKGSEWTLPTLPEKLNGGSAGRAASTLSSWNVEPLR